MKVYFLMLSVKFNNARKVCELVQNTTYKGKDDLITYLENQNVCSTEFYILNISEFMDACNSQELNIESYFISYFFIS